MVILDFSLYIVVKHHCILLLIVAQTLYNATLDKNSFNQTVVFILEKIISHASKSHLGAGISFQVTA